MRVDDDKFWREIARFAMQERWADRYYSEGTELLLNKATGDIVIHRPGLRPVYSRTPLS